MNWVLGELDAFMLYYYYYHALPVLVSKKIKVQISTFELILLCSVDSFDVFSFLFFIVV